MKIELAMQKKPMIGKKTMWMVGILFFIGQKIIFGSVLVEKNTLENKNLISSSTSRHWNKVVCNWLIASQISSFIKFI